LFATDVDPQGTWLPTTKGAATAELKLEARVRLDRDAKGAREHGNAVFLNIAQERQRHVQGFFPNPARLRGDLRETQNLALDARPYGFAGIHRDKQPPNCHSPMAFTTRRFRLWPSNSA
jgi:hypothetical protein